MQFRPACTAVSVAGVTIFTTFLLQPTKCNFLRYVCEHDETENERGGEAEEDEKKKERERSRNGARGKYCRQNGSPAVRGL